MTGLAKINRARTDSTRAKRLESMLTELAQGHGYLGMDWTPRR